MLLPTVPLPGAMTGFFGTPPLPQQQPPMQQPMQQSMQQSAQPGAPASPFTWGAGGVALTPEELANRRAIAQAMMKSNYSPITSVWQGLGRVADNVIGALDSRKLDKEEAATVTRSNAVAQALISGSSGGAARGGGAISGGAAAIGGAPGPVPGTAPGVAPGLTGGAGIAGNSSAIAAQAMTDPYLSPQTRDLAKMVLEHDNPKNDTVNDYRFWQSVLPPDKFAEYVQNKVNPTHWLTAENGDGTKSIVPVNSSGIVTPGGQPQGAPPATLPPDFDFGQGGPTHPASGTFRP